MVMIFDAELSAYNCCEYDLSLDDGG